MFRGLPNVSAQLKFITRPEGRVLVLAVYENGLLLDELFINRKGRQTRKPARA